MRYLIMVILLVCVFLSGCEYIIPHTSDALSQTKQLEELQKQTKQIEKQTDALERLSKSAERLANPQRTGLPE
ncbi:MAG: hypothetical protein IGS50_05870 [Synechococcales cyanobacterium C42_A2020_086]|jgi:uncharacterized protein YceK|nr:hypothetical protein [Synechococcales cyanobacterium C42_A2020_086]